jgi:hypothetical protein
MKYLYLSITLIMFFMQTEAMAALKKTVDTFDEPVKMETIILPTIYTITPTQTEVQCMYYPKFMVKVVYFFEEGAPDASQTSVTPITANKSVDCSDNTGEIEIKDWWGYFAGVKGTYVFLNSDDGAGAFYPFAAFDGTSGKKLFEDNIDYDSADFHSIKLSGDNLIMRYRRSYQAKCSLYSDKSCWQKIQKDANLAPNTTPPDCSHVYEIYDKYDKNQLNEPSLILYEAEATYKDGKITFAGIKGKVTCGMPE